MLRNIRMVSQYFLCLRPRTRQVSGLLGEMDGETGPHWNIVEDEDNGTFSAKRFGTNSYILFHILQQAIKVVKGVLE